MTVNVGAQQQDSGDLSSLDNELLGGGAGAEGQEAFGEQSTEEEAKPTYEELLAEVDTLKTREAEAQSQIGRQGQELGDWRQRFAAAQSAGAPSAASTPQSNLGPFQGLVDEVLAGVADWNTKNDPRGFAEAIARGVQQSLGRAYQEATTQQRMMAAFESDFWKAHEPLKEGQAREVFNAMLQQEATSGYHRNLPDLYEATAKRTLGIFEAMGLSYGEADARAGQAAAGVHSPGPRGARSSGGAPTGGNPEATMEALNRSYREGHQKSQAALRRPSQGQPKT